MKYYIKNKLHDCIDLNQCNFLNSGGEGDVYVIDDKAYKIYKDSSKMIPEKKIIELSILNQENIIKPQDIIINNNHQNCGYNMKYVKKDETYQLCMLFNKIFKDKNKLTIDKILHLIKRFQHTIKYCHEKNILLVDINELNFLVEKNFNEIFFIDVDSYQTRSYKTNAIMDNIRDRHCKSNNFNENIDWFSFGILSFNLFTGIHPYKGTHPNYDKKDLDGRMLNNISVLNKDVKCPPIVGNFKKIIPDNYYQWFYDIFENGKRCSPPIQIDKIIVQKDKNLSIHELDKNFITNLIYEIKTNNEEIIDILEEDIILSNNGLYINKNLINFTYNHINNNMLFFSNEYFLNLSKKTFESKIINFILTNISNDIIICFEKDNKLNLFNLSENKKIECDIYVKQIMKYDNRIYFKNKNSICELFLHKNVKMNKMTPLFKELTKINEYSDILYDGCTVLNLLGDIYVSLYPKSEITYQFKIKELYKKQIHLAKYENNILQIITFEDKKWKKYIFKINKNYNDYKIFRCEDDIDNLNLNFIVLDNGICLNVNNKGNLELFTNNFENESYNEIDSGIFDSFNLFKVNNKVYVSTEDKLYNIKMR